MERSIVNGPATPHRLDFQDLLEEARFEDILALGKGPLGAASINGVSPDLYMGIAAQHLGRFDESKSHFLRWCEKNPFVQEGPLVTIIIPTFNRRAFLKRALDSVKHQIYRPLEVVVVNDAGESVNGIVDDYNSSLDVSEVVNPANLYLARSRNEGLARAKGDYVCFLDDDDQLYPHHVGHLVALIEGGDTGAVFAMALFHDLDEDGSGREVLSLHRSAGGTLKELLVDNIAPVQAFLFKRDIVDHTGNFDGALRANEDWDFWIRLSLHSGLVASPHLTSCVDRRHERMSSKDTAPFLVAHNQVYRRNIDETTRIGGKCLVEHQRRVLSDLKEQVLYKIINERRFAFAILSNGEALDENAQKYLERVAHPFLVDLNDSAKERAEVVFLNTSEPRRHAEVLSEVLTRKDYDYLVVIRPGVVKRLLPNFLSNLALQMECHDGVAATAPASKSELAPDALTRIGPSRLAEDPVFCGELLDCYSAREGTCVNRLPLSCVLIRAGIPETLLSDIDSSPVEAQFEKLFSNLLASGQKLTQSLDTFLIDASEYSKSIYEKEFGLARTGAVAIVYSRDLSDDAGREGLLKSVQTINRERPLKSITLVGPNKENFADVFKNENVRMIESLKHFLSPETESGENQTPTALGILRLVKNLLSHQDDLAKGRPLKEIPSRFYDGVETLFRANEIWVLDGFDLSHGIDAGFYENCLYSILAGPKIKMPLSGRVDFQDPADQKLFAIAINKLSNILSTDADSTAFLRSQGRRGTIQSRDPNASVAECLLKTRP